MRFQLRILVCTLCLLFPTMGGAQQPSFRVLAFYTDKGEPDHIDFAKQALAFYAELAKKDDFAFESTTHWEDLNADTHWAWFLEFLGGGVFYGNNWPPLPGELTVDDQKHPVTRRLRASFEAP